MVVPVFVPKSRAQLIQERKGVEERMLPHTVQLLRRLHEAGATSAAEDDLLDAYDSLTWLIEG